MKYRIHFTLPDGSEDSIVVSADSEDNVAVVAYAEVLKRNATDPWSEKLP